MPSRIYSVKLIGYFLYTHSYIKMSLVHLPNNNYIFSGFAHARTKYNSLHFPKSTYSSYACGNFAASYSNCNIFVWQIDTGSILGNIRWISNVDLTKYGDIVDDIEHGHITYVAISNNAMLIYTLYNDIYYLVFDTFAFGEIHMYNRIKPEDIQSTHITSAKRFENFMEFAMNTPTGMIYINIDMRDRLAGDDINVYDVATNNHAVSLEFDPATIVGNDHITDRFDPDDATKDDATNLPAVIPYTENTLIFSYVLFVDADGIPINFNIERDEDEPTFKHLYFKVLDTGLNEIIKCFLQPVNVHEMYDLSSAYEIGRNIMFIAYKVVSTSYHAHTRTVAFIVDTKHNKVIATERIPTDATHCGLAGYLRYRCVMFNEIDEFNIMADIPAKYLPDMYVSPGITHAQHTFNSIITQLQHNMDTTHHKKHNGYLGIPNYALKLIADML